MEPIARAQTVTVRKATDKDIDQVTELLFGLKSQYGSCSETTLEAFRAHYAPSIRFALTSPSNSIWVAEAVDGTIVGFLSTTHRFVLRLAAEVGALEEIFVHPTFRRQGIGIHLWFYAREELRSNGVHTVEVVTSLAHPGQRQFARKLGLEWYSTVHRILL